MIVYLILNNGRPEQVLASEEDAVAYVGSKGGHNIQPFHLSALGKGGVVLPWNPTPPATEAEAKTPAPNENPAPATTGAESGEVTQ